PSPAPASSPKHRRRCAAVTRTPTRGVRTTTRVPGSQHRGMTRVHQPPPTNHRTYVARYGTTPGMSGFCITNDRDGVTRYGTGLPAERAHNERIRAAASGALHGRRAVHRGARPLQPPP